MQKAMESVYSAERPRLVSLCYRLTGNLDAAEDLAQETLLEAWRNEHKLHDHSGYSQWLSAIAKNVCMRWARKRGRDLTQLAQSPEEFDYATLEDDFDLDVELERHELVDLLDRAMDLLPTDTRELLVERYVRESPYAEIAARLGLNEDAVAKRLERGRLRLKRVLTLDLRQEAASHGLTNPDTDDWQETRIWCPDCGQRRLIGRFLDDHTVFTLRCPGCTVEPEINFASMHSEELFRDVKGFKRALSRLISRMDESYRDALKRGGICCWSCGQFLSWQLGVERLPGLTPDGPALHVRCLACKWGLNQTPSIRAFALPEAQRFWRDHPRTRTLPNREIEAEGVPAVVAGYESVTDSAKFEAVFVRDTFEPISIQATSGD